MTAVLRVNPSNRLVRWMVHHDESWLFVVVYLGLAVGLSVFVSLFWLLAVGVFHLLLELVRQAHYRDTPGSVVLHALWEIKMDVGLILLALSVVLYLEVVLGLLGLQSATRAAAVGRVAQTGARAGSRAAQAGTRAAQAGARAAGGSGSAMEQWVRAFILTVDDMARVLYAIFLLREWKRKSATPRAEEIALQAADKVAASGAVSIKAAVNETAPREVAVDEAASRETAVDEAGNDDAAEETVLEAEGEMTALEQRMRDTARQGEPEGSRGAQGQAVVNEAARNTAESAPGEGEARECGDATENRTTECPDAEEAGEPEPVPEPEAHGADDPGPQARAANASTRPEAAWQGSWAVSDLVGVITVVVGLFLLAAAPYLTAHEWHTAIMTIAQELRPLPGTD